ncbi:MAG: hypothetical protein MUF72_02355 [Elainella sp. Prado103]|nr:hypothetical protein [Elainella sp. Prado103]
MAKSAISTSADRVVPIRVVPIRVVGLQSEQGYSLDKVRALFKLYSSSNSIQTLFKLQG